MRFDFLDRRSAERFAELLDESHRRRHDGGRSDGRLDELVAIGHGLSAARSGVHVDPEFRVGLRAMLVATAERDGIGAAGPMTEPEPVARERLSLLGRGSARRIRARGAIVIGVAAGAMAVSGISAASESANPGDALYGVKRQTEKAQLAMAGSDVTRGQLSLDFAKTRLAEAAAMKGSDSSFPKVLADMDADTRQGVKLLTTSAVARKDGSPLNAVDGFAGTQRQKLEPVLEHLSPANRMRAAESIALLDDVRRRAADLRTGITCDPVRQDGTDVLGPQLAECTTGASDSIPADKPHTQAGKPGVKPTATPAAKDEKGRPGKLTPSAGPTVKIDPTDPVDPGDAVTTPGDDERDPERPRGIAPSTVAPSPSQSTSPSGGLLDGVLGGVLGN